MASEKEWKLLSTVYLPTPVTSQSSAQATSNTAFMYEHDSVPVPQAAPSTPHPSAAPNDPNSLSQKHWLDHCSKILTLRAGLKKYYAAYKREQRRRAEQKLQSVHSMTTKQIALLAANSRKFTHGTLTTEPMVTAESRAALRSVFAGYGAASALLACDTLAGEKASLTKALARTAAAETGVTQQVAQD